MEAKIFDVLEPYLRDKKQCRCKACGKKIPKFIDVCIDNAGNYYHPNCAGAIIKNLHFTYRETKDVVKKAREPKPSPSRCK